MNRYFRMFLYGVCAVQAFLAVAFILKLPLVVRAWPLQYTNTMSFVFIGSIFLAAAASTVWCLIVKQDGALAGIALDYMTIMIPVAILAFQIGRNQGMRNFGIASALSALFGLGLFLWSVRKPIRRDPPMPRLIKVSFAAFIIALLIAGGQLVMKRTDILPWNAGSPGGVLYGWMFIGAAAYFAYGLLRPSWHNAGGQLAGFLAYDLVLIVPFLQMLPTIDDDLMINLVIYLIVVSYSGLLAFYYLFVNKETRLVGRASPPSPLSIQGEGEVEAAV